MNKKSENQSEEIRINLIFNFLKGGERVNQDGKK